MIGRIWIFSDATTNAGQGTPRSVSVCRRGQTLLQKAIVMKFNMAAPQGTAMMAMLTIAGVMSKRNLAPQRSTMDGGCIVTIIYLLLGVTSGETVLAREARLHFATTRTKILKGCNLANVSRVAKLGMIVTILELLMLAQTRGWQSVCIRVMLVHISQ